MRKNILTITAIIIATVSAFSQSVTETRRIKTTALQIYENYKVVMSGLYSKTAYTEDNFMALFNNHSILYNDILPDNNPQQLSPARYFEKFKANVRRIYPAFSDFKMGEPVSVGGKWQIKCNFTRGTKFRTLKDMNYPEWSFNYTMTIEMDKSYSSTGKVYENAVIASVDVEKPLKDFFVIENKENIPLTAKQGETLSGWDEEYQSRIFPENEWKIRDIHVSESGIGNSIFESSKSGFSKNQTDGHFYQPVVQRFPKNIFGVGLNYPSSLSLFYGFQIMHNDKSTLFFDVGLDLSRYSFKYNNTDPVIDQTNQGAADGDTTNVRLVKRTLDNITPKDEKVNVTAISIPLSIQYLYQLTESKKPVFFSFELGVFPEYMFSSAKGNLTANFHGEYKVVDFPGGSQDRTFDHYYNYGDGITVNRDLNLTSHFGFGILGDIGLWFTLDKSNMLKFDISYKGSLSPLKYSENYTIGDSNPDKITYQPPSAKSLQNIGFGISWVTTIGGK